MTLDQLREKAENATPGPWHRDDHDPKAVVIGPADDLTDVAGTWRIEDAVFVAAFNPQVALALVDLARADAMPTDTVYQHEQRADALLVARARLFGLLGEAK